MPDLSVTLVQSDLVWEDSAANLAALKGQLPSGEMDTDLIVLPEMFATGFSMNPAPIAQTMDGPAVQWMRALAAEKTAAVTGSLIIAEDGNYYNRLIWAAPDGAIATYDKRHRFRMAGEHDVYAAGNRLLTVDWRGWRIRPFICYDLRFPLWTRNLDNAYDVALFVANWPERRAPHWRQLLIARAIENLSYVVGVNRVGTDGNGVFYSGDSAVIAPEGEVLFESRIDAGCHTQVLSRERLDTYRQTFPAWMDADQDMLLPPR
ncbi:MAG: amidohydrolase [Pseudomonadota bacterium]